MKTKRYNSTVQPVAVNNDDGTLRLIHPLLASRTRRMTHWLATQLGVKNQRSLQEWLLRVFVMPPQPVTQPGLRLSADIDELPRSPAALSKTNTEQRYAA